MQMSALLEGVVEVGHGDGQRLQLLRRERRCHRPQPVAGALPLAHTAARDDKAAVQPTHLLAAAAAASAGAASPASSTAAACDADDDGATPARASAVAARWNTRATCTHEPAHHRQVHAHGNKPSLVDQGLEVSADVPRRVAGQGEEIKVAVQSQPLAHHLQDVQPCLRSLNPVRRVDPRRPSGRGQAAQSRGRNGPSAAAPGRAHLLTCIKRDAPVVAARARPVGGADDDDGLAVRVCQSEIVEAGEQLRHYAALHLPLRCLALRLHGMGGGACSGRGTVMTSISSINTKHPRSSLRATSTACTAITPSQPCKLYVPGRKDRGWRARSRRTCRPPGPVLTPACISAHNHRANPP